MSSVKTMATDPFVKTTLRFLKFFRTRGPKKSFWVLLPKMSRMLPLVGIAASSDFTPGGTEPDLLLTRRRTSSRIQLSQEGKRELDNPKGSYACDVASIIVVVNQILLGVVR